MYDGQGYSCKICGYPKKNAQKYDGCTFWEVMGLVPKSVCIAHINDHHREEVKELVKGL